MMATVEEQGDHSSGHCSGFAPDSLLYNSLEQRVYHLSGDKDRGLFLIDEGKGGIMQSVLRDDSLCLGG